MKVIELSNLMDRDTYVKIVTSKEDNEIFDLMKDFWLMDSTTIDESIK